MIFPASWGFPASHLWPGGLLLDIIQLFDLILVAHSQHWPCEEVVVDLQRRNMVQRSQLTASIYSYIYIYLCVRLCMPYRNLYVFIYIHMYTYTNIQYTCVHWIHETYIIALPSHLTWFALTKALKSWNFSTQTNDEIINSRRTSIIIRLTCCCEMAWSGVKCCDVCQYCQCKKNAPIIHHSLSLSLFSLSLSLSPSPSRKFSYGWDEWFIMYNSVDLHLKCRWNLQPSQQYPGTVKRIQNPGPRLGACRARRRWAWWWYLALTF